MLSCQLFRAWVQIVFGHDLPMCSTAPPIWGVVFSAAEAVKADRRALIEDSLQVRGERIEKTGMQWCVGETYMLNAI